MTNIATVGDFRRRDMAYGSQGATLVPGFHQAFLAHPTERRLVLNIGGIANLSLLFPGTPVRGFDTGPGNMLMDAWVWRHFSQPYYKDTVWTMQERVYLTLLQETLADPYFARHAPKSTGREYFNIGWVEQQLADSPVISSLDILATLAELTAITLCEQVQLAGRCERLLLCGGGARNSLLIDRLSAMLPGTEVGLTNSFGISGDDMEALAFRALSGHLPSVKGASCETLLGGIYPVFPLTDC